MSTSPDPRPVSDPAPGTATAVPAGADPASAAVPTAPGAVPWAARTLRSFGRFWWEFLIGDTPELLGGAVVIVVLAAVLAHNGVPRTVTVVALPVLVAAMLCGSVAWVALRRRRSAGGRPPTA